MGLIANYSCLSDANLKKLKAMGSEEEEILESVEEWNDDDDVTLRVSAKGMRVIDKKGIDTVLSELRARGEKY